MARAGLMGQGNKCLGPNSSCSGPSGSQNLFCIYFLGPIYLVVVDILRHCLDLTLAPDL